MRRGLVLRSIAIAGCLALAAVPLVAAAAGTANPWGTARQVPGVAALPDYGGTAQVRAVSCGSPGDCSAVGNYGDGAGNQFVFTVARVNGAWHAAQELPVSGLSAVTVVSVHVNALSCSSAGNCVAGGFYDDSSGDRDAWVASEVSGTWQNAIELLGSDFLTDENAEVLSASCASDGNCAVGGDYFDGSSHRQAFVGDEVKGAWNAALQVPGTPSLNAGGNAQVESVSCATAGNCAAGGYYTGGLGNRQAFVVSESGHTWGTAREVAGRLNTNGHAVVLSVSCAASGNCAAGGDYDSVGHGGVTEAFVVSEVKGKWGPALEVPGTGKLNAGGDAEVSSVSCPSPGNCAATGFYLSSSSRYQAYVASELVGVWHDAMEVPGTGKLNVSGQTDATVVSCVSSGACALSGDYMDKAHHTQAFVTGEAGGRWAVAEPVPGAIGLNKGGDAEPLSISCASATSCAVGGLYSATPVTASGFLDFGALPQTSKSALTLSAAKVVFGHEQGERLTVKVSPQRGGTPTGTVTVRSGSTVICTVSLGGGKGSCTLAAKRLPVGRHSLTAGYAGSVGYSGSTSAAKTVTVVR